MSPKTKHPPGRHLAVPVAVFSIFSLLAIVLSMVLLTAAMIKQAPPTPVIARAATALVPGFHGLLFASNMGPHVYAIAVNEGSTYHAVGWRSETPIALYDGDGRVSNHTLPTSFPSDAGWGSAAVVRRDVQGRVNAACVFPNVDLKTPMTGFAFGIDRVFVAGSGVDVPSFATGPRALVWILRKSNISIIDVVSFAPNEMLVDYEDIDLDRSVSSGAISATSSGGFALALWGKSTSPIWKFGGLDVTPHDHGPFRAFVVWCDDVGSVVRWWGTGTSYDLGVTVSVLERVGGSVLAGTFSTSGTEMLLRDTDGVVARTLVWEPFIVYVFAIELDTVGDYVRHATLIGISRLPILGETPRGIVVATESCGISGASGTNFTTTPNPQSAFEVSFVGKDPNLCGVIVVEYTDGGVSDRWVLSGTSDTYLDSIATGVALSVAVSTRRWGMLYVTHGSLSREYRIGRTDADTMSKSVVTFIDGGVRYMVWSSPKLDDSNDINWNRIWLVNDDVNLYTCGTVDEGWVSDGNEVDRKVFAGVVSVFTSLI